ncbi:PRC-barrel domain-containing protein [Patulibacter americanus]|uniref:PRC-barrel domain-containing protein n=1 Tax=Patulibacter americanus TaxID=588672 RepID=UPI0003B63031|nr:PRC-barrel domain-containing protein [Patulibacter americanus]
MNGPDIDTALDWRGRTVRDADGEKIGSLGDVYLDQETDRPAWGGVRTGLFGRGESLIPLDRVTAADDGDLHVPFARDHVKDAPRVDPDVALDRDEEARLYAYYDGGDAHAAGTGASGGSHAAGAADHGDARTDADERSREGSHTHADADARADANAGGRTPERTHADVAPDGGADADRHAGSGVRNEADEGSMIRSEEEVVVKDGPMRPAERVRLKKVMVTDEVEKTVPVRREVIQLEHEPPPAGTVESVEDVDEPGRDQR